MIKMILMDVDGTLIPEGESELEEGLIDVIKELQKKVYRFAVASGRAFKSLVNTFGEIKDSLLFLGDSGTCVFNGDGELLKSIALDKDDAKYIYDIVTNHPCAEILLGTGLTSYVYPKSKEFLHLMRDIKKTPIVEIKCFDDIKEAITKISSYCPDDYENFKKMMVEKGRTSYHIEASGVDWVDYSKGNKADGIAFMCEMLQVDPKDCMYFGDSHNDLEALRMVGYPVVMEIAAEAMLNEFEHHATSVKSELEKLLNA